MDNIIKGIFLLILTAASNFIAETLGCKTQTLLGNSMMLKHLLNLFLIYFAINLTSDRDTDHPLVIMKRTLYVWIGFILFVRLNIYFTGAVLTLLVVAYILGNYIEYYEKNNGDIKHTNILRAYREQIFNIIPIVIAIGFLLYSSEKYNEYGPKFNFVTFFLGNTKCKAGK
jgi:hypothetical protein